MIFKKHLFTSFIAIIFALEQIISPKSLWAQVPSNFSSHPLPLVYLNGMEIQPNGNLHFSWTIYNTNSSPNQQSLISYDKKENLAYFLTALALPDENLWVNLNITLDETAILGNGLAMTDLGKLFLQTDIQLKKDVKDIFEKKLIWNKIIDRAQAIGWQENEWRFKPRFWIVPGKSVVLENDNVILIKQATLKIQVANESKILNENDNKFAKVAIAVINEKVIPELEKRINSRPEYAKLRQAYRATILAQWYENKIEEGKASLFSNIKDVGRIKELWSKTLWTKRQYLNQYIDLYRNAAITQDIDEWQFYSGGVVLGNSYSNADGLKLPPDANIEQAIKGDGAGIHSQQGEKVAIDELTVKENSDKKSQKGKNKKEKTKSNTKLLPFLFILVTTIMMIGLNGSPAFAAPFFPGDISSLIQKLLNPDNLIWGAALMIIGGLNRKRFFNKTNLIILIMLTSLGMVGGPNWGISDKNRTVFADEFSHGPLHQRTYHKNTLGIKFLPGEKTKDILWIPIEKIRYIPKNITKTIRAEIGVRRVEIANVEGEKIKIIFGGNGRILNPGFSSIEEGDNRVVVLEDAIALLVEKEILPALNPHKKKREKIPERYLRFSSFSQNRYLEAVEKDFKGKTKKETIKAITQAIVIHEIDHKIRELKGESAKDPVLEEDLADLRELFQGPTPFYTLFHLFVETPVHLSVAEKFRSKIFGKNTPVYLEDLVKTLFSLKKERLQKVAKEVYIETRDEIRNNRMAYFSPLVKKNGKPSGEVIGEGIVFSPFVMSDDGSKVIINDKLAEQVLNALKNSNILGRNINEERLRKVIKALQRYFKLAWSNKFDLLPQYTIELRKNVLHYAAFDTEEHKIILDIDLLTKLTEDELLPTLAFILSHEGLHSEQVYGTNEELVQKQDKQRLSRWNKNRQQKLISALRKLGHSEEELEKYITLLIDKTGIVSDLNELEQTLLEQNPDTALTGAMTILSYIQDVAKAIKDGKIRVENISSQLYTSADMLNMFSGTRYYSELLDMLQKMGYDNAENGPLPVIVAVLLQKNNIVDGERVKELEEVYKSVAIQLLTDKDAANQYIEAIKEMNKGLSPSNDQDDLGGISFASLELKTISLV